MLSVLAKILAATCIVHLLLVLGEMTLAHPTAHARLAASEMLTGKFRTYFWVGIILVCIGILTPWVGLPAGLVALVGLLAHEHAYIQAGQIVPLA